MFTQWQETDSIESFTINVIQINGTTNTCLYYYHCMCVCVLLVSSTKQSRNESSPVIKEFFSEKNEAYGIIKGPDHQSPIEVTENVAYSTMEQQPSLNTPPVYETIN